MNERHDRSTAPNALRRRRARRPIVALVLAVVLAATGVAPAFGADPATSVGAPPAAPAPASADDVLDALRLADAGVEVAQAEAKEARAEMDEAEAALGRVQRSRTSAADAEAGAAAKVAARRVELKRVTDVVEAQRIHMRRMARETYVHSGAPLDDLRVLLSGSATDELAQSRLMSAEVIKQQTTRLRELLEKVPARRSALHDAKAAQAAKAESLAVIDVKIERVREKVEARTDDMEEANDAVLEATAEQSAQRSRLALAAALPPQEVPTTVTVLGPQRLSAEDLAGWFVSSGYTSHAPAPITELAQYYIEEGEAEGVRGDIAFAQAILETGGFRNRDTVNLNNYSGIGHCDSCGSGWRFASARAGVRAQIQLLKSYALKSPTYRYPLVDRRLRGPAGCCQTWQELTSVWATGPEYGKRIMEIYARIVDYALTRRSGILRAAGLPIVAPPPPVIPIIPPKPIEPSPAAPVLVPRHVASAPTARPTTTTRRATTTTRRATTTTRRATTTTRRATTTTRRSTTTTTAPATTAATTPADP